MPAPGDCRYRSVGAAPPHVSALGIIQSPPVCLAISCRAIEEFQRLALTKESAFGARLSEQPQAHVCLAQAEALVRSARTDWHENGEAVWDTTLRGSTPSLEERTAVRLASLTVVKNSWPQRT